MRPIVDSHRIPVDAILNAFDVLGEEMKRVLVFHLEEECGLSLKQEKDSAISGVDLQTLSRALSETFGQKACELIMGYVFVEMDEISSSMIKSDFKADSNTI